MRLFLKSLLSAVLNLWMFSLYRFLLRSFWLRDLFLIILFMLLLSSCLFNFSRLDATLLNFFLLFLLAFFFIGCVYSFLCIVWGCLLSNCFPFVSYSSIFVIWMVHRFYWIFMTRFGINWFFLFAFLLFKMSLFRFMPF